MRRTHWFFGVARSNDPDIHRDRLAMATVLALGTIVASGWAADSPPPPGLLPRVQVQTTLGDFVLELNAQEAPRTVKNFLGYVESGFYDGTLFHRVSKPSVIQGGAYTEDMTEKKAGLREPIPCESHNKLKNQKGAIAMYRIPGQPNSARAQFFINVADNFALDLLRDKEGYAVFGKVVDGLDVVQRIVDTPVSTHPKYAAGKNPVVPVTPVVIKSMKVLTPLDTAAVAVAESAFELGPERHLNTFLKRLESQKGAPLVTTPSGLRYIDERPGNGAFPLESEAIEYIYRGTLLDGKEFDSSERQSQGPHTINVANAIPGLKEALLTMREGGKRTIVVPPELGYGQDGVPNRIPPNATLVYEIELLTVKPAIKRPTAEDVKKANP